MSDKNDTQEVEPIVIKTTAPIPVADLKRKFTETVQFHIDVDESRLKNNALITYLSNLNIDVRLLFKSEDVMFELLKAYMNSTALVSIFDLEDLAINIILCATGKPYLLPADPTTFIQDNFETIELWVKRIDSLPLYAMHCVPATADEVLKYPEDTTESLVGLNFVKLIEHPQFPVACMGIEEEDYNWNKQFFNEYCFAGSNLFTFFESMNNPFFIAMLSTEAPEQFAKLTGEMEVLVEKSIQIAKEEGYVSLT